MKEMDRDVASSYLEMHNIVLDLKPAIKTAETPVMQDITAVNERPRKQVTFKMNATEADDYNSSVAQELLEAS